VRSHSLASERVCGAYLDVLFAGVRGIFRRRRRRNQGKRD
jgi:hypothetical protein